MDGLERLLAIEEIRQLKARYFRYIDTREWSGFTGLFSPDALIDIGDDIPGCVNVSLTELFKQSGLKMAQAITAHHGHFPEIEIGDNDTARGIWPMEDNIRWADNADTPYKSLKGYGHYYETYVKLDGKWFIKSMKLKRLLVDYEPHPNSLS